MLHKVAIITVVYENYTVLKDLLDSLRKQSSHNFYMFCIDVSIHRKTINYKNLAGETIYSKNKGYAHGVNTGLKKALDIGFEYFCVINNDVYFDNDFVKNVLNSLSSHHSAIVGGKIYYAPGYEYHKDRYKKNDLGKVLWYAGGSIDWNHALTPHRGVDQVDSGLFESFSQTDFVNGAFMLFDKSVLDKVGFWDESYFLYFEDADFSVRAKKAGIRLFYDPSLVLWHKNSQSTGGSGSKVQQKYQKMNRLRFGLRYAPLRTKLHLIKNYLMHR